MLIEAISDDSLRHLEKETKRKAERTILNAAKLIAPVIEGSLATGFDWSVTTYTVHLAPLHPLLYIVGIL